MVLEQASLTSSSADKAEHEAGVAGDLRWDLEFCGMCEREGMSRSGIVDDIPRSAVAMRSTH